MAFAAWLLLAIMCSLSLAGMGMCDENDSLDKTLVNSPSRSRRSDDVDPLTAVVNQLSQEVLQLKTSLAGLEARLAGSQTTPVSFTVHFSKEDVAGLRKDQVLVFDVAGNNIGNGYNTRTGFFTAPVAGSYVFFLAMQRHNVDETTFIAAIMKGSTTIGYAEAGYSPFEHGSMLVTTHLEQGETVCVRAVGGSTVYGAMTTVFSGFLL